MGGHGADPQEQNTQHCPALGRISRPQDGQSADIWHESSAIRASCVREQCGHVMVETRTGVMHPPFGQRLDRLAHQVELCVLAQAVDGFQGVGQQIPLLPGQGF